MSDTNWSLTAAKSGKYEFKTGGKYVDRDIDITIPAVSEESVTGSGINSTNATATVAVSVDSKNSSGKYPFKGSANISGTTSGTATYTTNTGFANETTADSGKHTKTGTVSGSVSGTAGVSGSMNAIGLSASGTGSATITTITPGTKTNGAYKMTGSANISGTASASVSSTGYGTAGTETGSGSVTGTASLNSSINAAALTVTGSATVKPNGATASNGNAKVAATATTTSAPTDGSYYIGVTPSTAESTNITQSKDNLTAGYLGADSEVTATGSVTGGSGTKRYIKIQKGSVGVSASDPGTSYAENTTAAVSSGGYLKLDEGYYPATKISLGTLIGDDIDSVTTTTASSSMLEGTRAYDVNGNVLLGNIPTKTSSDLGVNGATVTVPSGYYGTNGASATISSGSITDVKTGTGSANNIVRVLATTPTSGYYPVLGQLNVDVEATAGYISGGKSFTNATGGTLGIIAASTITGNNATATASASANTTHNLASGTYTTSATTGYTYHVDATASASVDDVTATKSISVGYVGTASSAVAKVTGASSGNKSSKVYIKDGVITNNTSGGTSTATINAGKQIKIAKGYYPSDLYYTAQTADSALTKSGITGKLEFSIDTGYVEPSEQAEQTLVTAANKKSNTPYMEIVGNGQMTAGNIYNGTASAKTMYLEVYAGSYSIT